MYVRKEILEKEFYDLLKSFQPNNAILDLFEQIVLDVWKNKQTERMNEKHRLEKELRTLETKKSKLVDFLIHRTIDEDTYKQKTEEIKNDIFTKRIELNENEIELNDVGACLNYCKYFLSNISNLWANADLNLKQRFQNLIFPEGIYFNGRYFRTPKISLIFSHLQGKAGEESRVAALPGFEPGSDG